MSYNINGKPLYISSSGDVIFEAGGQVFIKNILYREDEDKDKQLPWELYSDCWGRLFYKDGGGKKVYLEEFLRYGFRLDWKKVS